MELYLFDIRDPKTCKTKNKIIALASLEPEIRKVMFTVQAHVTLKYKVTLDSCSVELYLFDICYPLKTCRTKKDHRSSVIITRDKNGHVQGHVTLSYKITLISYSVVVFYSRSLTPKNLQNKKTFFALAFLHPDIF